MMYPVHLPCCSTTDFAGRHADKRNFRAAEKRERAMTRHSRTRMRMMSLNPFERGKEAHSAPYSLRIFVSHAMYKDTRSSTS